MTDHMQLISDDPLYWILTIPGLTEEGSVEISNVIRKSYPDLQVVPCDPQVFLPMFMDEFTVRLIKAGLERLPMDAAVEGMLFDLNEWLEAVAPPREGSAVT
jgi:hypothetical protein